MEIRKATRKKAKLRLGIMGSSGSGKTYSALQLAFGLGGKVGLIDTEHGSGELYAHLGDYDVIQIEAPYTVPKYREAIKAFEEKGYSTIIIDSLTHAWAGEGGLLDKQGQLENSGKFRNSFATWREITPEHNKLVEELLNSTCHIIGTMRSKTEYVLETNDKGKQVPRKVGMAPVQRDGMEYEFTLVFDVNDKHYASATKDRTGLFNGWCDTLTKDTGKKLSNWLNEGVEAPVKIKENSAEDWKSWSKNLADEIKQAETADDVSFMMMGAKDNLSKLKEVLPDFHKRLSDVADQQMEKLQKGAA